MTHVTLDPALLARLQSLDRPVEFRDESGRTVGYFHPLPGPGQGSQEGIRSPFTDEELQRRRQQRTGRPLADILKDLGRS